MTESSNTSVGLPYLVLFADNAFGPITAVSPEEAVAKVNEKRSNQFTKHANFEVYPVGVDSEGNVEKVELSWSDVE